MKHYVNLSIVDLPNESWKNVPGLEKEYSISSYGRIKSIKRNKIKHQHLNADGYLIVTLCRNGKYIYKATHRIVAEAFIPHTDKQTEVDHIDGDRTNNIVSNLRWVTHKQNMNNPRTTINLKNRKGPMKGRFGKLHPKSKQIYSLDEYGNITIFESLRDAQRKGFNFRRIHECLYDNNDRYKNMEWHFLD